MFLWKVSVVATPTQIQLNSLPRRLIGPRERFNAPLATLIHAAERTLQPSMWAHSHMQSLLNCSEFLSSKAAMAIRVLFASFCTVRSRYCAD